MAYHIWTTGACNLNCRYCYEGSDKPNISMSKDIAYKVLQYIFNDYKLVDGELVINFHGGEPFLNFDAVKFFVSKIKERYKNNVFFTATTNGTVLTSEIIDYILSENIEVTISIDGEKNSHDLMRPFKNGTGSHDIVMFNSLILLDRLKDIRIRMTYNPENVYDLSKNVKYLLEQGFLTIAPGIDSFDKRWDTHHVEVLKGEIIKIKQYLKEYPNASVGVCEKLTYCGEICNGGITSKHIYFDGTIYPCTVTSGTEEFKIGSVDDGIDVVKRDELLSYSSYKSEVCKGCDITMFCMGSRCKIINKVITGHFDIPAPIDCNYTNLIYNLNGVDLAFQRKEY